MSRPSSRFLAFCAAAGLPIVEVGCRSVFGGRRCDEDRWTAVRVLEFGISSRDPHGAVWCVHAHAAGEEQQKPWRAGDAFAWTLCARMGRAATLSRCSPETGGDSDHCSRGQGMMTELRAGVADQSLVEWMVTGSVSSHIYLSSPIQHVRHARRLGVEPCNDQPVASYQWDGSGHDR
jgi:hypothetical protein